MFRVLDFGDRLVKQNCDQLHGLPRNVNLKEHGVKPKKPSENDQEESQSQKED